MIKKKPNLNFWQIWNLSFGFLGVQIGYALQNANTSRIFQAMGADVSHLSYFWLAAPLAGFIVQPIVGMFSDSTWTKFGRRIPFILGGAIISTIALFLMPNANILFAFAPLLMGAVVLLFMDMSFNITMQPFRALVADMLDDKQKTKGYVIQTFLINLGAIIGAVLPYILTNWVGLDNSTSIDSPVSQSLAWAYYVGGGILLLTVLITSLKTKEFPPQEFAEYNDLEDKKEEKISIFKLIKQTPKIMLQLSIVQFFSWTALFLMWNYLTPAIADNVWGALDANSTQYGEAANWVGVLNGIYPIPACIFALFITSIANKYGNKLVYAISLICGGLGFVGLATITEYRLLILPMIGIGVAWAGILSMPYSILSKSIEPKRMGVYMGIFNFSITIPQIFIGIIGGIVVKQVFDKSTIGMIFLAGALMFIAAACVAFVKEKNN